MINIHIQEVEGGFNFTLLMMGKFFYQIIPFKIIKDSAKEGQYSFMKYQKVKLNLGIIIFKIIYHHSKWRGNLF